MPWGLLGLMRSDLRSRGPCPTCGAHCLPENQRPGFRHLPQEYFTKILKKLKEVGASADRTNFYV